MFEISLEVSISSSGDMNRGGEAETDGLEMCELEGEQLKWQNRG